MWPARSIDVDATRDQLDLLLLVEFFRPEHQALGSGRTLDVGLRQRRPLIRQMRLVVDQANAVRKSRLTQRCRGLIAGMAGTDNDHRTFRTPAVIGTAHSCRHERDPRRLLPTDFGLLASSGRAGARVRPQTKATPFEPIVPPAQEAPRVACQHHRRGLSPLTFCDLVAQTTSCRGIFRCLLPSPSPTIPRCCASDGPIATITLNRPAGFNSVNLAIAQKLEQLAAYYRRRRRHPGRR